jgi:hypothetical protein
MGLPFDPPEIQGGRLSSLDRFWLALGRSYAKESVRSLEAAAKQLIAVASFAQTVISRQSHLATLRR